jgi:hypothetical protein
MHLVIHVGKDFRDEDGLKWEYYPLITGNNWATHGIHGYSSTNMVGKEVWLEQTDQIEKYLELIKKKRKGELGWD